MYGEEGMRIMADKSLDRHASKMSLLKRRYSGKLQRKRMLWAYLFILPQLIFFIVFTIYPIVMSYVYSVYNWSGIGPLSDFIGFENYLRVIQDDMFWNAFKNTFIYMLSVTVILLPTSLLLAYVLNYVLKKSSVFYRTIYFLPVVTTTAIVGIILRAIFSGDGLFNQVLLTLGIIDDPYAWLGKPLTAMIIVILVGAWKFFGMMMVYWLAALQTLPQDVMEAARIDGCNSWNLIRYVTIPILLPVGAVILLLSATHSLHVFDMVKTLTNGGPYFATDMVDLFIYRNAFTPDEGIPAMGFASAAGVVFGIASFVIVILLGWFIKKTQQKAQ